MTDCNKLKLQQVKTCNELLKVIEDALDQAPQDVRCRFGRHTWGAWNMDRHPRSKERSEAFCPLIHFPMVYRHCTDCDEVQWGHEV